MKHYFLYPIGYDFSKPLQYSNLLTIAYQRQKKEPIVFDLVECVPHEKQTYYGFLEKNLSKIKPEITEIDFSKYKTVAFMPGCTIPRYKANELFKSHNIKTVRDIDKADLVISNDKASEIILQRKLIAGKAHVLDHKIMTLYFGNYDSDVLPKLNNAISEGALIWTLIGVYDYMKDEMRITRTPNEYTYWTDTTSNLLAVSDISNMSNDLYLEKTVDEKVLSGLLGELAIDADTCQGIEELLKSDSLTDITMAMKVMTNSNFEKSYFYLMYLMHTYFKQFNRTTEINSVAFKSLREYLGFKRTDLHKKYGSHHIDEVIKAAIQNGMYDDNFMQKIYDVYPAEFNYNGSKYVKPLTFMLTDLGKDL